MGGFIQGISEAPGSTSFPAMAQKQRALAQVILRDPAVECLSSFIGVDGTNTTLNSGRILINLKPLADREISASGVMQRLQRRPCGSGSRDRELSLVLHRDGEKCPTRRA